ncbi:hypothetical protein LDO31_17535 [Luteimonas sp. XNQY3]|nr:hypothetical protein [Luteimonas sp. XNQY3]MCD9008003.1 hypothetical protein [Luteimonas sp. XNQY3]
MSAATEVGFTEAAEHHLRDALQVSHAERWRWLQDAMAHGVQSARARGRRGLATLGPHGEVIWSALHERVYASEDRLITDDELAEWKAEATMPGASRR